MSLYNLVNGMNSCTFLILPMLGKHPDEYPRFRDCFLHAEDRGRMGGIIPAAQERPEHDGRIHVYTRVGGGNREGYAEQIRELRETPGYVTDYDDDFDSTFATFVFQVPEQWREDFSRILDGKLREVSDEYLAEVTRVFPKLTNELTQTFRGEPSAKATDEVLEPAEEFPNPFSHSQ